MQFSFTFLHLNTSHYEKKWRQNAKPLCETRERIDWTQESTHRGPCPACPHVSCLKDVPHTCPYAPPSTRGPGSPWCNSAGACNANTLGTWKTKPGDSLAPHPPQTRRRCTGSTVGSPICSSTPTGTLAPAAASRARRGKRVGIGARRSA